MVAKKLDDKLLRDKCNELIIEELKAGITILS